MWRCRLCDGSEFSEGERADWKDISPDQVMELWFPEFPGHRLRRSDLPGFSEFIQFKTACVGMDGTGEMESQTIGWTDGEMEYGYRRWMTGPKRHQFTLIQEPRRHFYPLKPGSTQAVERTTS